ncbi:MAG TPA: hypothetical protein VI248_25480 [Kineosporiaceae bacterium]
MLYAAPSDRPYALGLAVPPRGRLACSRDGSLLAARTSDTTIGLWEPATAIVKGELVASAHPRSGEIRALQVAPDGAWVAAGEQGGLVRVWNVADGTQRFVLDDHHEGADIVALAASADGRTLLSAGRDGVRAWDTDEATLRVRLVGHSFMINAFVMSEGESWLAAFGGLGGVLVWDLDSNTRRAAYPLRASVAALAAPGDGRWLAAMSPVTHSLHILHPLTAGTGPIITVPDRTRLSALTADPGGRWVAAAGAGHVWVWNPRTGHLLVDHDLGHDIVDLAPFGNSLIAGGDLGPYLLPANPPLEERTPHSDRVARTGSTGPPRVGKR